MNSSAPRLDLASGLPQPVAPLSPGSRPLPPGWPPLKRIAIVGWVTGFIASILFHIAWPLAHYALWKAAHAEIPESEALADR